MNDDPAAPQTGSYCDRMRDHLDERWVMTDMELMTFAMGADLDVAARDETIRDLRRRLTEMHRRAQRAESIIAQSGIVDSRPQRAAGRSLGRALANYAAERYRRERDESIAASEVLLAAMKRCAAWPGPLSMSIGGEEPREILARAILVVNEGR